MRSSIIAAPSVAALIVAGVAPAGAYEVTCEPGLVYGRAGGVDLLLDLYRPVGAVGARPAVLFVHGGGWQSGERGAFAAHAEALAALGYVAATCDYRLAPDHPYPAALDDCQLAMRWLRSKAAEFSLDPARLGAVGSSAGGHLAACLAVRETRDPAAALAEYSSRATVVVDVHGIHDLPALGDSAMCARFCGGALDVAGEAWRDASPIEHVDRQAAPCFLLHDPGDQTVPYEQSVAFAAALMRAGRPVQFEPTPGSGHGYVYNFASPKARRVWPLIVAWLGRWLSA